MRTELSKMKTELNKSFDYGFMLNEQELRRIYNTAREQMMVVAKKSNIITTFKLKYKNGTIGEHASLEEVLSEENIGEWTIQTLTITLSDFQAENSKPNTTITVKFDAEVHSNAINYNVLSNDRDWVYLTSSKLEERIANIKIFSPVSLGFRRKVSIAGAGILTIIIGLVGNILGAFLTSSHRIVIPSLNLSIFILFFSLLILVPAGVVTWVYYSPPYNFYWGEYIASFERRRAISSFFLFILIFTILISIIAVIIANFLTIRFGGGGSGG